MQIAILGPLEVRDNAGRPVDIAGARLRTLLMRLAVDAGRWVATGALVDAVWGEAPPADEANALQTLVSRARRALGDPQAIGSSSAGYRLTVEPDAVDAACFEAAVRRAATAGREGDADLAAATLDDALALWRGPALVDAGDGPLGAEAVRLDQLRQSARVERAELRAASGTADLAELAALTAEQPLNENLAVLTMRALAAAGRQADALQAYESLRARLADELGVDPSATAQAVHLDLLRGEASVPIPTPTSPRRTNLRVALTSFVGRDAEQQAIRDLLEAGRRLVTLVGPGGAGKTRLASEAARDLLDEAPDGVWLAELAAVTAGADVAQAVLAAVGLRELHGADPAGTSRDAAGRLASALTNRRLVIVLDNCEHVLDAAAELTEVLLGECAGLRILATSREPLAIGGEALYPVPPLPRPSDSAAPADASAFASVSLFADRAASVRPGFVVDATTVGPVVEIVRRLDGLPLAIELAAARLRSMPLDDIAGRLSDRFRLLAGGSRTALPRHRTLRAVVEWSWDLLSADERSLVEALSVFPGGLTTASAEAVAPGTTLATDVADLLSALVDKSLLQPVGDGRRLRMLETIREFGMERLAERGELDATREAHARYFAGLLREAAPVLVTRDQLPWCALLRAEQENALAAIRFLTEFGDADATLQAAIDLALFALLAGNNHESAGWLGEALTVPGGDDRLRIIASALRKVTTDFGSALEEDGNEDDLDGLAEQLAAIDPSFSPLMGLLRPGVAFLNRNIALAHRLLDEALDSDDPWIRACSRLFATNLYENEGDVASTRIEAELALTAFRELGERWGTAGALRALGQILTLEGDLAGAGAAYDESMQLRQELSTEDDIIFVFNEMADLAMRRGDEPAARRFLEQAIEQARRAPSDFESFFSWLMIAEMERRAGSHERSRQYADDARARLDAVPANPPMQRYVWAMLYRLLGALALDEGDSATATRHAAIAYEAATATQDLPVIASFGVFAAELLRARGDAAGAARRLGASERLRGAEDGTSPDIRDLTAQLRAALGDEEYEKHNAAGRALGRAEAIAALDPAQHD